MKDNAFTDDNFDDYLFSWWPIVLGVGNQSEEHTFLNSSSCVWRETSY
jgi:hypothetical protein